MNKITKKNGELIYSFSNMNDYEDLEAIEGKLREYFTVDVTKKLDGPDMRVWDLDINSKKFQLYNDPYGNYLITNILNEEEIEKIASNLTF